MNKKIQKKVLTSLLALSIPCFTAAPLYATEIDTPNSEETTSPTTPETTDPTIPVDSNAMEIKIVDSNNNLIKDLEFEVRDTNNNLVSFTKVNGSYQYGTNSAWKVVTSNSDGKIYLDQLPAGKYTIVYTNNNKKYTLPKESQIMVDKTHSTATIQAEENIGSLKVVLLDETDTAIKDAKFEIKDSNGNNLTFAIKNGVYVPVENGNKTLISSTVGKIVIENMPTGTYKLIQVEAPEIYNGKLFTEDFTVSLKKETLIRALNTKEYGSFTITSVDKKTNEVLKNSEFSIFNSTGDKLHFKEEDGIFVFNKNEGSTTLRTKEGKIHAIDLPVGEYIIKEVNTPAGYDKSIDLKLIITKNKDTVLNAKNAKSVGGMTIHVNDLATGNGVESYVFNIVDKNENPVKFIEKSAGVYAYKADGSVTELKSNSNGKITIEDMPLGEFGVKQLKASSGYVLDPVVIRKTIIAHDVISYNVVVSKSNASITVMDDLNSPAVNVPIKIKDSKGNIVFEGKTNDNGKILITGIATGSYSYIIKDLPSPYINKTYSETFTINTKGEIEGLNSCVLAINRVTLSLSEKVAGVKFTLTNKTDASKIFEAESDENGKVLFDRIPDGTYVLEQIEAPADFAVSTETKEIVIDRNSTSQDPLGFDIEKTESTTDSTESTDENPEIIPGVTDPDDKDDVKKEGNKVIGIVAVVVGVVVVSTIYAVIKTKKEDSEDETIADRKAAKAKKKNKNVNIAEELEAIEEPEEELNLEEQVPETSVEENSFEENNSEEDLSIELTRPDSEDFMADPYEQEELEAQQLESENNELDQLGNDDSNQLEDKEEN